MDMRPRPAPDPSLIEDCLAQMRKLPFVKTATLEAAGDRAPGAPDACIALVTPTGREVLPCVVRGARLGRETAELLIHQAWPRPGTVVLARAVGREIGDLFAGVGLQFVDSLGNCYLRLGDRYLARIQDKAPPVRSPRDRGLRAAAYRVLFALLAKPVLLDAPVREIARAVEVSPQTASNVLQVLAERGLILHGRGHRRWAPGRRDDALATWIAGFRSVLAPSLVVGRFRAQETDPRELERRIEPLLDALGEWRYGGGAAATRLTHHFRGDRTVLYFREPPPDLQARLRLTRDPRGPIAVFRAPGTVAFESPDPRSVHPLLVYADLLSEDDERAREAAGVVHERLLAKEDRGT